jgi:hypothetical protein
MFPAIRGDEPATSSFGREKNRAGRTRFGFSLHSHPVLGSCPRSLDVRQDCSRDSASNSAQSYFTLLGWAFVFNAGRCSLRAAFLDCRHTAVDEQLKSIHEV